MPEPSFIITVGEGEEAVYISFSDLCVWKDNCWHVSPAAAREMGKRLIRLGNKLDPPKEEWRDKVVREAVAEIIQAFEEYIATISPEPSRPAPPDLSQMGIDVI